MLPDPERYHVTMLTVYRSTKVLGEYSLHDVIILTTKVLGLCYCLNKVWGIKGEAPLPTERTHS